MKLRWPFLYLLIVISIFIIVSCGPTKQEQIDLLNQKIKRLNELVAEQKDNKEKRQDLHKSAKERVYKEFEHRMGINLQQNINSTKTYSEGNKSIMEWMNNISDSLNQEYLKDSAFFNQNVKTIDSLQSEISKYKSELDLLLGIK